MWCRVSRGTRPPIGSDTTLTAVNRRHTTGRYNPLRHPYTPVQSVNVLCVRPCTSDIVAGVHLVAVRCIKMNKYRYIGYIAVSTPSGRKLNFGTLELITTHAIAAFTPLQLNYDRDDNF